MELQFYKKSSGESLGICWGKSHCEGICRENCDMVKSFFLFRFIIKFGDAAFTEKLKFCTQ